jgi:hypothetical protein
MSAQVEAEPDDTGTLPVAAVARPPLRRGRR